MKLLMACIASGVITSCSQNKYADVHTSGLTHSSPEVISLYENEKRREDKHSGGFGSWLFGALIEGMIDSMLGSDPDDDHLSDYHRRSDRKDTSKRQRQFVSKNGETLRDKLESKKQ